MAKIVVIDQSPFWRELVSDALRLRGHDVSSAEDNITGLAQLSNHGADLIVFDTQLTGSPGYTLLDQLRTTTQWKNTPAIILTSEMHKDQLLRARQLGVVDYLLKTQFSLKDLIDRVDRRLNNRTVVPAVLPPIEPESANSSPAPEALLTREKCLARAMQAMGSRTLSGVVAQVIASASSPRTDMSELAALVGRDPMLSARVVAAANRMENATDRRTVSNLWNAVRVIGSSTIRDIAASLWVYDTMPAPEPDGYNPIRCWQHSIAVARLCEILAPEEHKSIAYLLGLCHDLGEILFRSHFGSEYRQVLETAQNTGISLSELERQMLGLTHGELVQSILTQLELPDAILQPINAFHSAANAGAIPSASAARLLMVADAFSTGLMLNSSDQTGVRPLNRAECRGATGLEDPPAINCALFRAEVVALTAECARMSSWEESDLLQSPPPRLPMKVWLARDPSFSSFDPIAAALDPMVNLTVHNRLPAQAEMLAHQALIVLSRNTQTHGLTPEESQKCVARAGGGANVLYICGKGASSTQLPSVTFARWPITVPDLMEFVHKMQPPAAGTRNAALSAA